MSLSCSCCGWFYSPLKQALQLAREHRYAEAEAALKGVPAPSNPAQKIAFYRLKAAIASGLGHFSSAAEDMDRTAALAPGNQDLRVAAGIARLEEQVENHTNPAQTLKRLRNETLPPQQAIDVRLHLAEILSRASLFSEAATDFAAASAPDPMSSCQCLRDSVEVKSVQETGWHHPQDRCFGGDNASSLVVAVIFAGDVVRQPSHDNLRPCQANETNGPTKGCAVVPCLQ